MSEAHKAEAREAEGAGRPRAEGPPTAGRAAGYCWDRNPAGPGRCTWPPGHGRDVGHKDTYSKTAWPCA
ncbi:hypothetical protein [Streptomyces formicae]